MDINHQDNRNRRLSVASCERIILYVDDFAAATGQDLSPEFYNRTKNVHASSAEPDVLRMDYRSSLYPSSSPVSLYPDNLSFQLDDRSALYPPHSAERSPSPNPLSSQTSTPRRSRCNLDVDQRSSRRSSIQSSRSRTNSCSKPTPLGDDRRASVSKKTRPRRASSTVPRRDSVRPAKADVKETPIIKDDRELEQARRHRRIAMIVLGTFIFLVTASILVVVVTLTQSSFLSPATGSKELAEHRAQLRKENEELLNSLNRDISVPENVTAPP
ncbi:hypothetical protein X777_11591 [Ooceraea biroi]|uniref:Uncharacterized protein n=1 Tax=Ooceraea biroi TaxID=2015173 RepID=A0A026W3U8_OOCBI|nr:hypothetical protein X777_11591 [Ooceraea biroi]